MKCRHKIALICQVFCANNHAAIKVSNRFYTADIFAHTKGMQLFVGYACISTIDQSFDLQVDELEKAGCEKIFKEAVSGAKTERKALSDALEYVRQGDTLIVWRLDRLGRSLKHLIEVINNLHERKIGFKSLVDAIDTQTPTGQFFFHVTGAFAELERNLIRERTQAGLKAARARGRNGGRPKAIDPKTFNMALEIYNSKKTTVGEMCKRLGIAKRTFYRHLEMYKQNRVAGGFSPPAPTPPGVRVRTGRFT